MKKARASVVVACRLSSCGTRISVALEACESSQTRDQTRDHRIGGQILVHCATKEV